MGPGRGGVRGGRDPGEGPGRVGGGGPRNLKKNYWGGGSRGRGGQGRAGGEGPGFKVFKLFI